VALGRLPPHVCGVGSCATCRAASPPRRLLAASSTADLGSAPACRSRCPRGRPAAAARPARRRSAAPLPMCREASLRMRAHGTTTVSPRRSCGRGVGPGARSPRGGHPCHPPLSLSLPFVASAHAGARICEHSMRPRMSTSKSLMACGVVRRSGMRCKYHVSRSRVLS